MSIESFVLPEYEWVPNNPTLPVLIYRAAVEVSGCEKTAEAFEAAFDRNGWPPQWRDGVFDYHHYHSTAHEALGVAAGLATLTIGGPGGRDVRVEAGDALMLPVGTGHRCLQASADFLVVGAYPKGQNFDICRDAPSADMLERMAALPAPPCDPLESGTTPSEKD